MRYYRDCEEEEYTSWLGLTWASALLLAALAGWGLSAFVVRLAMALR